MTEVTQVEGAPDTSIEKPETDSTSTDVQTAPQDGSNPRSTEQVAESSKYWQSVADRKDNELNALKQKNDELKQADVLLGQIKNNPNFVQDLKGEFSLKDQPPQGGSGEPDDDDIVTGKEVKQYIADSQKPVMEALRLNNELTRARELLGEDVSIDDIQKAYNTRFSEADILLLEKLKGEKAENLRAGAESVTEQIERTQNQSESVVSAPSVEPEPEKEPEDNVIGGVKRAGMEKRRTVMQITRT